MAASLLTTGCGGGADAVPADPAASLDPALPGQTAVQPAPQTGCPSGADAVPTDPATPVELAPAVQSVPPDEAASEATPTDPDPCGLSGARTAPLDETGYWTQERMDSATSAPMPIENEPRREGSHSPSDPSETIGVTPATSR
ncbi:hypothetical protein NNX39_12895 [Arthrobacter sp. zg-Y826]|uniref:hypothetical protein n=1 Tax=Arthrobacter jinronghuae TaxID=2964609 RepID=UPI002103DF40|nr:hypothetical protein [Arthrobacter jinronghuae]MCQ1957398.1 hypothetical protein [Arthrobacter jinronghuae]